MFKIEKRYGKQVGQWQLKQRVVGKKNPIPVPQELWPGGLRKGMSYEEAYLVVQSLNASEKIKKEESSRIGGARSILSNEEKDCAYLPEDIVQHFIDVHLAPFEKQKTYEKLLGQWKTAKKIIVAVNTPPKDWHLVPTRFYEWFLDHVHSVDYVRRVMSLIDRYHQLYMSDRGSLGYFRIRKITEAERVEIEDLFIESNGERKSGPLFSRQIPSLKLPEEEANWVVICQAFGLRPEECDLLLKPVADGGWINWVWEEDVLCIWQPKLRTVRKKDRYKRIPIVNDRQRRAKELIDGGNFVRPTVRHVRATFPEGVSLYGCRHGFTHEMEAAGHEIGKISKWLGHRSQSTTERYYRDHGILAKAA